MISELIDSGELLDSPPPNARPFDDERWACVSEEDAVSGLQNLVRAITRCHRRGVELRGIERRDLALDEATGCLYLVDAPRLRAVEAFSTQGHSPESVWRDARLVGELAYENFMAETYPGGHQMAALLQERETMAEMGLLQPGLSQLVAACVSPYGELAMLDIDELSGALEQLRREVARQVTFRVGARSTLGNYVFRRNNQDACAYLLTESVLGSVRQSIGFFCVADGIGGIRDGERASQLAAESACRAFGRAIAHYGGAEIARHPADFARAIVQITSQRLALQGEFDPDRNRGGTTFTCLVLAGERAGIGHVGDSRAVLVRDGELLQLTQDHTLASIFEKLGDAPATGEEADTSHRTISRFLGTVMELEPSRVDGFSPEFAASLLDASLLDAPSASNPSPEEDLYCDEDESHQEDDISKQNESSEEIESSNKKATLQEYHQILNHIGFELRSGDLFILTSDGVHDEVSAERFGQFIAMHGRSPQKLVDALVKQALHQVGRDNATAMAIRVE